MDSDVSLWDVYFLTYLTFDTFFFFFFQAEDGIRDDLVTGVQTCALPILEQKDGVVPPLLARLGIRNELLMKDVDREIGKPPKAQGFGQHHMSRSLNEELEKSFDEAEKLKDDAVSTEHLFLAIAAAGKEPP